MWPESLEGLDESALAELESECLKAVTYQRYVCIVDARRPEELERCAPSSPSLDANLQLTAPPSSSGRRRGYRRTLESDLMEVGSGRPTTDDPTVVDRPSDLAGPVPTTADAAPTAVDAARPGDHATPLPTAAITTAAEAMRDEEVQRTRLFIRIGWLASLAGMGAIPFVDSEPWMIGAFVGALVIGMVVSFGYHQAFRDPRKFGPRPLFVLGVMSTINTHVAILFFGAFTIAPVLIVIGLHFIGRSELDARRAVWWTAGICHGVIALVLISGVIPDPGVFATARPLGIVDYVLGAIYVQAAYALAYHTGRSQRLISLRSIEQLQRATRVASQRAALLDELRIDLARAQQVGAGRYTEQTIGGYRLGAVIGRGAHGEVYEASSASGDAAAVKVLHHEHLTDPKLVARFLREARATIAIASPHVVRVLATSDPDAAVPFLAMERLRGTTLADLVRRTGKLSTEDALAFVTQVAVGLDAAGDAGIVHRDLKPHNLVREGMTWKVLDFGVATLTEHTNTLTLGGIVGTPQYMAPEQARGIRVDRRTDLHALAVLAYRVLTGRNPFGGPDTPSILYAVVHTMPVRPSLLANLDTDVDRWTAIALAKDPEMRFPTGAILAGALADALRGELPPEWRHAAERLIGEAPWQEVV